MQPVPFGTSTRAQSSRGSWFVQMDFLLLAAALGLVAASIYTIAIATEGDVPGSPLYYVIRQSVYAVVGIVVMFGIARFDYSRLREAKLGIYTAMLSLILLVFAVATATRGSKRWIELPFFRFQPSELGKVLLILALAAFVVDRMRRLQERETTSRIMLLAIVPATLVVAQPDLGTGLVYISIALTILFIAGTKWSHFTMLAALGASCIALVLVAAPAAGVEVLKPYQVDRLTAFINPSEDPQDQGYQLTQSTTAIGSGQKTGRGPDASTQTKLDFLPEHHTDFVFAVVGEGYGFMGAALVLSLFALLLWRAIRIMTMAKNLYGTLIAGGIIAMLLFQIFVNVGMTLGIMPITGVPLPLLSFGGSSLLVTFMALGLLQSIHVQARDSAATKGREPIV